MILKLLLVAAGGALGSVMRFLATALAHRMADTTFPIGTMAVNVIGCLCIGILGAMLPPSPHALREEHRLLLMVGVLGGFTTFSAFGLETFRLFNEDQLLRAGLNVLATNIACLGAVWLGYRLTERLIGA